MPPQTLFVPKETYVDLYWNQDMSICQIGDIYNTPSRTIIGHFKKMGIPRKNNSESHKGQSPWNKGKTRQNDKRVEKNVIAGGATRKRLYKEGKLKHPRGMLGKENKWGKQTEKAKKKVSEIKKRMYAEGKIKSWNKGKTKETDEQLKEIGKKISKTRRQFFKEGKIKPTWKKGEKLPYPAWNKGKPWSEDIREKLSGPRPSMAGEKHPNWKGGISFEPYCLKFNDAFKEEIRDKFGRKCFLCPKTEEENGRKLCVHHVNYNKNCLCDDSECEFVPLCDSCHSKTNFNQEYWELTITTKIGATTS